MKLIGERPINPRIYFKLTHEFQEKMRIVAEHRGVTPNDMIRGIFYPYVEMEYTKLVENGSIVEE